MAVLLVGILGTTSVWAKKDPNAWKQESNREQQFLTFKKNLNFWDGYLFFKEGQINEYYGALNDSIQNLERTIGSKNQEISALDNKTKRLQTDLNTTQTNLEEAVARENSFTTLGIQVSKGSFATIMYTTIALLIIACAALYVLYRNSHVVTKDTKEKFDDLNEEFDLYRKSTLEKMTKLGRELHDAKAKLKE